MTKIKLEPPIAENRKARHDFFLIEKFEAGICLQGHEVKSIREGRVNLKDSFVRLVKAEPFLFNCHISPYSRLQGYVEIDSTRSRKLLLHHEQVDKLLVATQQKGNTIVPTKMYLKRGLIKVEIAIAKGKKLHDKREDIKKRLHDKESAQALKAHTRKRG